MDQQIFDDLVVLVADSLPDATACWLAGSRMEQLGNANSDLDVYAVVKDTADINTTKKMANGVAIEVYFNERLRIDVEHWPEDAVHTLAKKFSSIDPHDLTVNILDVMDESEVDFIHRILTGVCIGRKKGYNRFASLFSQDALADYLMYNQVIYLDDAIEDSLGMLESGDWRCAALRTRDALGFASDVLLHASGDTNSKAKYRWTRLLRLQQKWPEVEQWVDNWWSAQCTIPQRNLNLAQYSLSTLALSEQGVLLAEALRERR